MHSLTHSLTGIVKKLEISKGAYDMGTVGHSKGASSGSETVTCDRVRRLASRAVVEQFLQMATARYVCVVVFVVVLLVFVVMVVVVLVLVLMVMVAVVAVGL